MPIPETLGHNPSSASTTGHHLCESPLRLRPSPPPPQPVAPPLGPAPPPGKTSLGEERGWSSCAGGEGNGRADRPLGRGDPPRPEDGENPPIFLPRQPAASLLLALDIGGTLIKLVYTATCGSEAELRFAKFERRRLDDCFEFVRAEGLLRCNDSGLVQPQTEKVHRVFDCKKKGYSDTVQDAITQLENKLTEPTEDGHEPSSVTEVVSDVLAEKTKKNKFLQNVGIQNMQPRSTVQNLEAELAREKKGNAKLREIVNIQREQVDVLLKQLQEAEEAMLRQEEEMKKQAEPDAKVELLSSQFRQRAKG